MIWFSDIVATLAVSQLALLAVYFLTHYEGSLARLMSLFSACLCAYVLATMSFVEGNSLTSYLLFRLATLAPFLLWMIAFQLFVDSGEIPITAWLAMGFFVVVRGIGSAMAIDDPLIFQNGLAFVLVQLVPQLILLYFSVHAIYLAYQGYSVDLLEQRRRLRVIFVVFLGILISTIVGMGFVSAYVPLQGIPTVVYTLCLFVGAFLFNLFNFRLSGDAMTLVSERAARPRNETPEALNNKINQVDPDIVNRIAEVMTRDRLYTQQGLTIADLAKALNMQEYRLRRLINQTMQYRNFNQFLNNYRIEEASRLLRSEDSSISNIALDVGYTSLSVFNKAFKDRFGITPSAYRQQQQPLPGVANEDKLLQGSGIKGA